MLNTLKNLWFRDPAESDLFINDVAVRIRAGMLLAVPLYMGLTLYDVAYTSNWLPIVNTAVDTYETDWDGNIIYTIEATKRTYEYSVQTIVLFYALFEMLAGLFVITSRLSPTIFLSTILAKSCSPVWKPLVPKRYAWMIGASLITLCIVFFNPDTLAEWVNKISGSEVLPTTENYMPFWIPTNLVWICVAFMWLETVLGFCVGCKVYSLLVWMGVHKEACEACNDIDWEAIARKNEEKKKLNSSGLSE
ncbi:MAG: DUF4395 domain-containing protein [Gammaproteobacteria bacterium]|nr:MAG: DUF4395 domain-containing protein [Gammaproteobacteria bacterium]